MLHDTKLAAGLQIRRTLFGYALKPIGWSLGYRAWGSWLNNHHLCSLSTWGDPLTRYVEYTVEGSLFSCWCWGDPGWCHGSSRCGVLKVGGGASVLCRVWRFQAHVPPRTPSHQSNKKGRHLWRISLPSHLIINEIMKSLHCHVGR